MRILVCGLGSAGRRHLRNLVALGEAELFLYRTGKSTLPDDDLAEWPASDHLETALADWAPEAVVIANPTSLHVETALSAVAAGCHVLLEKPVSHRLEGVEALQALVAERRVSVLVGYQFRFHPGLRAARELLMAGSIGRPVSAEAHWGEFLPGWHPWEDYRQGYSARADLGGGVLLTLSHPFDYLRWLLGEVIWVTAEAERGGELDIDVDTLAHVVLGLGSGVLASVHLDYYQRPTQHWLEIIGTQGWLRWDNATGRTTYWNETEPDGKVVEPPKGFERNTLFVDEMRHFLDVAGGRARSLCSLDDGVRALRVALAALVSSKDGRRVDVDDL
jgi:predicted dehydrogenase